MNVMTGIMNASSTQTPTGLKRWSCQDKQLPAKDKVRAIHIYDFDNTRELPCHRTRDVCASAPI